jgi:hypothetical protein
VYRLICKDTIEEKILQRAKQKNAVQELVMKGKHVQDDHLMRQEDVVSLLLDDTQIAHKLKEISMQVTSHYHFLFFATYLKPVAHTLPKLYLSVRHI